MQCLVFFCFLNYASYFSLQFHQLDISILQDVYALSLISLEHKKYFNVSCLSLCLSSSFFRSSKFSTFFGLDKLPHCIRLIGLRSIDVQGVYLERRCLQANVCREIFLFFSPQRSPGNNWNGLVQALYHLQSDYVKHGWKLFIRPIMSPC